MRRMVFGLMATGIVCALLIGASDFTDPDRVGAMAADKPEKPSLVLTTPDSDGGLIQYSSLVFREAGRRSDMDIAIKALPKTRAIVAANDGDFDGVANRLIGLEQDYPNLRRVGVSHLSVLHIVYAKKPDIADRVRDFKSLNEYFVNKGYVTGYLLGSKKADEELADLPQENKLGIRSLEQAFGMLELGRIDAFLAGPGMVSRILLRKKFSQSGITEVGVFSEFPLYPYLHVKHAAIIPILEKALQSIKDDGLFDQIRKTLEVQK